MSWILKSQHSLTRVEIVSFWYEFFLHAQRDEDISSKYVLCCFASCEFVLLAKLALFVSYFRFRQPFCIIDKNLCISRTSRTRRVGVVVSTGFWDFAFLRPSFRSLRLLKFFYNFFPCCVDLFAVIKLWIRVVQARWERKRRRWKMIYVTLISCSPIQTIPPRR